MARCAAEEASTAEWQSSMYKFLFSSQELHGLFGCVSFSSFYFSNQDHILFENSACRARPTLPAKNDDSNDEEDCFFEAYRQCV